MNYRSRWTLRRIARPAQWCNCTISGVVPACYFLPSGSRRLVVWHTCSPGAESSSRGVNRSLFRDNCSPKMKRRLSASSPVRGVRAGLPY